MRQVNDWCYDRWSENTNFARTIVPAVMLAVIGAGSQPACAQIVQTLNGPPVQVIPYVSEPGVPEVTITPGTLNPFAGADGDDPAFGSGSGDGTASGGSNVGSTDALNTMLATSWGNQAVTNATALGVNPAALAAMCVAETTTCQNIRNLGGGAAFGPFQMMPGTFSDQMKALARDNPSLAASLTQGQAGVADPATSAAATAEMLKGEANQLIQAGIPNPTMLQVRGGAFGNAYTVALAKAADSQPLGEIFNWSPKTYSQNGLTPTTTVGEWRQSQTARMGGSSSANQSVLLGR